MGTRERVLVVDDDPDVCDVCAALLEAAGYQVSTAESAEAGLRALARQRPDLLILDVMMEEADSGFRLAEAVARMYPGLPVLVLSSIVDASAQVFDISLLPVSEFANKPIRPAELRATVRRLLDRSQATRAAGQHGAGG